MEAEERVKVDVIKAVTHYRVSKGKCNGHNSRKSSSSSSGGKKEKEFDCDRKSRLYGMQASELFQRIPWQAQQIPETKK